MIGDPLQPTQQNPLLDHPVVKAAFAAGMQHAHNTGANPTGVSTPPDGGNVRSISPMQDPSAHPAVPPIGAAPGNPDPQSSLRPGGSAPPMPMMPPPSEHVSGPPPLGSIQGQENETARLIGTGSGASQIKNPVGRGLAEFGSAVGHIVAPGLAAEIPGTEDHNQRLIQQSAAKAGILQGQRGSDTENSLRGAQAEEALSRAHATENPPGEFSPIGTDQGELAFNKHTGGANPITVGGQTAQPIEKQAPQNVHVLPSGEVVAITRDPKTGKSTAEVVYQGDPKQVTKIVPLQIGNQEHSVLVDEKTGSQIKDLGPTGNKPPTVNVNAGNAELDRISGRLAKPYQTGYDAGSKTLERMELTKRNVDAGYAGQGLAIPELLTSLVSGQGTGVRITQPELNAITAHRGIRGSAESFFNSLAGKGALTGEDKTQIKGVIDDAEQLLRQKVQIHSGALDAINGAGSREDAVRADKEAREKLNALESGGGQQGGPPPGATHVAKGDDGQMHYTNSKGEDLGVKK